jgi:deoxyribodipyrimidine photo-lyase
MMKQSLNIFWFRRDLRLHDNVGLWHALQSGLAVLPIFIFDLCILNQLENKSDRRVEFIHQTLDQLQRELALFSSTIETFHGYPENIFEELRNQYELKSVYTNHDYEPYARDRDELIRKKLKTAGIAFLSFKDQVIFEKEEIIKDDGSPYTIYTPYSKKWKEFYNKEGLKSFPSEKLMQHFYKQSPRLIPSLESMGFKGANKDFPSNKIAATQINNYSSTRDFPGKQGTSRLGIHLRFGTISIRQLCKAASERNEVFLNELIWREFYQMILWNFPAIGIGKAFKAPYEWIQWRNDEKDFKAWCLGETGYPLVDAGMRELNETGYMHNRVRMVTASFLSKHLLIDWRWGEAYFAARLLDFDFASNNGGWQWSSGSGCDAAPYFRIFNPLLQAKKFDPDEIYVRRWIPEYETTAYPRPMIAHELARKRTMEVYAEALRNHKPAREKG